MTFSNYERNMHRTLWSWSDQHHKSKLDGGKRVGRPPVLARGFESKNILVPPNRSKANDIRTAIPCNQRHRWFRSLKSSQALAHSVFGAVRAFDLLDLLKNVSAECGRPAFFKDQRGWTLDFEHKVDYLGEPTPTSIDVLLSGPNGRVAVECKFMERDFGRCSRPRLHPGHAAYSKRYCDGNYQIQRQRRNRCALTEIGVRYWDHLPHLFNWPADRDHEPCPFDAVYQLARNALAAALTPAGKLDKTGGHVLVVYDDRNPAFQAGGEAARQWDLAVAACCVSGLLRRLSWQRLLAAIACAPQLNYLVNDARGKYGL